jgi:hypothetical protein
MCLLLYIVDTGAISTETMDSSKTLVYGSQFTDNNKECILTLFFYINIAVRGSLYIPWLVLQVLKLMTI